MMSNDIDWRAIGAQLCAPFDPADVSFRLQGNPRDGNTSAVVVAYLDSRAVQQRLDDVCGPDGWAFDWQPVVTNNSTVLAAKGTITIAGISKSDVGDAGQTEPTKASVSDALKRTAVLWGIGRYLYELPRMYAECVKSNNSWVMAKGEEDRLRRTLPKPDISTSAQHAPHSTPRDNLTAQTKHATPTPSATPAASQAQATTPPAPDPRTIVSSATEQQLISIRTLCNVLGRNTPTEPMTYAEARQLIGRLNEAYRIARQEGATR